MGITAQLRKDDRSTGQPVKDERQVIGSFQSSFPELQDRDRAFFHIAFPILAVTTHFLMYIKIWFDKDTSLLNSRGLCNLFYIANGERALSCMYGGVSRPARPPRRHRLHRDYRAYSHSV